MDKRIILRKLDQKLFGPIWVKHPETIQLDTHNFCNLSCEYCNVQHSFNLPKGKMPLETVEYVLKYFGKKLMFSIALFMNGEPMLDERLPVMCSMAKQYCDTQCLIDTNGTIYENRKNLVHPNLKLVRFTISAITSETYAKVHGKPYFDKALATFNWFLKNKLPSQKPWLHFIACKDNEHELNMWIKHFNGIGRTIFPVHRNPEFQLNSEAGLGSVVEKAFMLDENGNRKMLDSPPHLKPCPVWDIMAVSWDGRLLQCCDMPYEFNYGRVGEVDLLEAWHERNRNMMDNKCCHDCRLKYADWKQILQKHIQYFL